MDIAITTKEMLINDFCIRIYFLRIVSVSSASLWSCVINSSILENFSSGRVRLTKVSRMNLSYMSEWKWRIHLNRPVRTIVNRRADTYIQHPHIRFPVKCHPYGIYAIGRNQFIGIIHS